MLYGVLEESLGEQHFHLLVYQVASLVNLSSSSLWDSSSHSMDDIFSTPGRVCVVTVYLSEVLSKQSHIIFFNYWVII